MLRVIVPAFSLWMDQWVLRTQAQDTAAAERAHRGERIELAAQEAAARAQARFRTEQERRDRVRAQAQSGFLLEQARRRA